MFERLELLIKKDNLNKINDKNILVVGVGGVGGYTVMSLIRSGIKNITIIDFDVVDITNLNRQIIAYHSTVGKKKVDVLEEMILDVNPNALVTKYPIFLNSENIEEIFNNNNFDYVIDACDSIETKKSIITECLNRNIKFITSMGTGNKLDPSKLLVTELMKTNNDPIARILRKWARDNNIKNKIPVVTSLELPKKVGNIVSSTSFVPASAGLLITSYVINDIINTK